MATAKKKATPKSAKAAKKTAKVVVPVAERGFETFLKVMIAERKTSPMISAARLMKVLDIAKDRVHARLWDAKHYAGAVIKTHRAGNGEETRYELKNVEQMRKYLTTKTIPNTPEKQDPVVQPEMTGKPLEKLANVVAGKVMEGMSEMIVGTMMEIHAAGAEPAQAEPQAPVEQAVAPTMTTSEVAPTAAKKTTKKKVVKPAAVAAEVKSDTNPVMEETKSQEQEAIAG